MSKLILAVFLAFPLALPAASLTWDAADGAEGYQLYFTVVDSGNVLEQDVGNVTTLDLDTLGLTEGNRYGFYLRSYVGGAYSMPSNTVRYTVEPPPQIIETPAAPQQLIINFAQ